MTGRYAGEGRGSRRLVQKYGSVRQPAVYAAIGHVFFGTIIEPSTCGTATLFFVIDPKTDTVIRAFDCSELVTKAQVHNPGYMHNGIACHAGRGTVFSQRGKMAATFKVKIPVR